MVKSILDGTDTIIDQWLGLDKIGKGNEPRYRHVGNLQLLSEHADKSQEFDGKKLIDNLLAQINDNWQNRPEERRPSGENWRFNKQLNFDFRNPSLEKSLEKSIAIVTENNWANQVPVASGLIGPGEGGRAIDLVHQSDDHTFEFIELKVNENAGGPLFASMEILLYGLLYVFSRENIEDLEYDSDKILFSAEKIELQVLAPAGYYQDYKLAWLESALTDGLSAISKNLDYQLSFRFRKFHSDFHWEPWSRNLLNALEQVQNAT